MAFLKFYLHSEMRIPQMRTLLACPKGVLISQVSLGQEKIIVGSGHPTDPNFNPRPYKIFFMFPTTKQKKMQAREKNKNYNLLPKYHDGNGYFS
jgi:hypothetical protein